VPRNHGLFKLRIAPAIASPRWQTRIETYVRGAAWEDLAVGTTMAARVPKRADHRCRLSSRRNFKPPCRRIPQACLRGWRSACTITRSRAVPTRRRPRSAAVGRQDSTSSGFRERRIEREHWIVLKRRRQRKIAGRNAGFTDRDSWGYVVAARGLSEAVEG